MNNDERSEMIEKKLFELRKVLDLVGVAEEMWEHFPDDPELETAISEVYNKRYVGIHMAFVEILALFDDAVDYDLVDLMERNQEADGKSEEVDREIEAYFGNIERNKKKRVVHKRRRKPLSKLNIVIDLDNTLFGNTVVNDACKKAGIPRTTRHDLKDLPQEVQDECWANFEDPEIMCNLTPYPEAIGLDKILEDAGHCPTVVTARSMCVEDPTIAMVHRHFPLFRDVVVLESWDKTLAYKNLCADVVIDDHSAHIFQALDAGVEHVIMVSNEYTTYNHEFIEEVKARGAIVADNVQILRMFTDEVFGD